MLTNETPFAAQELFLADAQGRDLLVLVVKATLAIRHGGPLALAEAQRPVDVAGTYHGDPETSSPRFEPEVAPVKLATDVVLVGHAHAPHTGVRQLDVGFRVGPISKVVRVFGDRFWYGMRGTRSASEPAPFWTVPLVYERAFGGWDRSPSDPDRHVVEPRNPVGVGYHPTWHSVFEEGSPLPNLEDPRYPVRDYADVPPPAGFGFTGPNWLPRAGYAGTYDEAWVESRMPLLPEDFDARFYNAAPADQIAPGYLRGDEPVVVVNASPESRLEFNLPGWRPPQATLTLRGREDQALETRLDTVIVDADEGQVMLIWRGSAPLPGGPHALREIVVSNPTPAAAPVVMARSAAYLN